jgi:hypothetical protein
VSHYPKATDSKMVGKYPALAKSGGGYFYDEVLEYRVWCHPEQGAVDEFDGDDYFYVFKTYEEALKFSESRQGAEQPLVLLRQLEHINEPEEGVFEQVKEERITEWQVQWLEGSKRGHDSISKFLAEKSR